MTDPAFIRSFLDEYYLRMATSDIFHSYRVGEYYPHSVSYCPLKNYYNYVYGPSISSRGARLVSMGNLVHELVLGAYRAMGYRIEVPFRLYLSRDVLVRGRADAVGVDHIVEIKSTSHVPRRPYPQHVLQATLYMKALSRDRAVLHYISRRDMADRIFEVDFDPEKYAEAVSRIRSLHEHLVRREPPSPDPVASWECDDCAFRSKCPLFSESDG